MRKINKMDVVRLVLVLMLVAGIGLAFGAVGRFVPTHKIVQPVYCGSCHPEQVQELSTTTHLGKFADEVSSLINGEDSAVYPPEFKATITTNARTISAGCTLCHNFWENMKWFGVKNFDIQEVQVDNPEAVIDIYGNVVSPYGLASTTGYVWNVTAIDTTRASRLYVKGWDRGIDDYQYTDPTGTYTRLDYVWSRLSAVSPGPAIYAGTYFRAGEGVVYRVGCAIGNTEHGLCHIAAGAAARAALGGKYDLTDVTIGGGDGDNGLLFNRTVAVPGDLSGTFYTHEMAFTTAQYAAKPVKLCGACHVFKLPPMMWGGEPWAINDIRFADDSVGEVAGTGINYGGPFDFRPTYNDLVGLAGDKMPFEGGLAEANAVSAPVAFRTADWAHANVPCIRCHAHAGVNGDTVTMLGELDEPMTDPSTGNVFGENTDSAPAPYPGPGFPQSDSP